MPVSDHNPSIAARLAIPAPAARCALAAMDARLDATTGGPEFDPAADAIDRLPVWLAGGIVVGFCGVFWIGILTIVGWLV